MTIYELILHAVQEASTDLLRRYGVDQRVLQCVDLAKDGVQLRTVDGRVYQVEVREIEEVRP